MLVMGWNTELDIITSSTHKVIYYTNISNEILAINSKINKINKITNLRILKAIKRSAAWRKTKYLFAAIHRQIKW